MKGAAWQEFTRYRDQCNWLRMMR